MDRFLPFDVFIRVIRVHTCEQRAAKASASRTSDIWNIELGKFYLHCAEISIVKNMLPYEDALTVRDRIDNAVIIFGALGLLFWKAKGLS